ncbi:MAG: HEPN domain-containing protein [Chloroflexi bacterium]|nr:HEPN domain-containing protein [Chloroflexota bacterium]
MSDDIDEIASNIQRARISIQAAKDMIEKEYYDIAASRSYYAAFYAASALLLNEKVDTSKHSSVIASIHRLFVKEGKMDKEQGKSLNWLFELRGIGDYGVSEHVSSGEAHKSIKVAEKFLESAIRILSE